MVAALSVSVTTILPPPDLQYNGDDQLKKNPTFVGDARTFARGAEEAPETWEKLIPTSSKVNVHTSLRWKF